MPLYTTNGEPLQVAGHTIHSVYDQVLGRIQGDRVLGPQGHYGGTIVGDRLIHRPSHSAALGSPFTAAKRAGTVSARRAPSAWWGDEPDLPTPQA